MGLEEAGGHQFVVGRHDLISTRAVGGSPAGYGVRQSCKGRGQLGNVRLRMRLGHMMDRPRGRCVLQTDSLFRLQLHLAKGAGLSLSAAQAERITYAVQEAHGLLMPELPVRYIWVVFQLLRLGSQALQAGVLLGGQLGLGGQGTVAALGAVGGSGRGGVELPLEPGQLVWAEELDGWRGADSVVHGALLEARDGARAIDRRSRRWFEDHSGRPPVKRRLTTFGRELGGKMKQTVRIPWVWCVVCFVCG